MRSTRSSSCCRRRWRSGRVGCRWRDPPAVAARTDVALAELERLAHRGRENARMTIASKPAAALSGTAFATLLLIALMMGANHVAARLAFDNGVDVATAVCFRSTITAAVVGLLMWRQRVPLQLSSRHRRALPAI